MELTPGGSDPVVWKRTKAGWAPYGKAAPAWCDHNHNLDWSLDLLARMVLLAVRAGAEYGLVKPQGAMVFDKVEWIHGPKSATRFRFDTSVRGAASSSWRSAQDTAHEAIKEHRQP